MLGGCHVDTAAAAAGDAAGAASAARRAAIARSSAAASGGGAARPRSFSSAAAASAVSKCERAADRQRILAEIRKGWGSEASFDVWMRDAGQHGAGAAVEQARVSAAASWQLSFVANSPLVIRYMGTAWRSAKEAADFLFSSMG